MNETLQAIRQRRSIRKFQDTPIPDESRDAIIEAGRLAPSAMNRQERHFTIVQSQSLLADLNRESKAIAATSRNRHISLMAQSENYNIFHHAPLVIVVSGPDRPMVESDCAAAIQNMLIAAQSLGYGSCWVNFALFPFNGPKGGEFLQRLGIPEGYRPYGSLVVGVREDGPTGERVIRGNTVNTIPEDAA
ncbi:MAG: nitroreductase family protein [Burkholderiaceae bacterium]|jgi:nitroreductase|nr:nitroreductase family protein [Burkholderiaceae bacterium]